MATLSMKMGEAIPAENFSNFGQVRDAMLKMKAGFEEVDEEANRIQLRNKEEIAELRAKLDGEINDLKHEIGDIKDVMAQLERDDADIKETVAEKIAKWENRITVVEKAAAGNGEERSDTGGGKLDIRDIKEWNGPSSRDFYDDCWYFCRVH